MFFRLSTERAEMVTIRDFASVGEVAGALTGYGLTVDETALASELAKGPWSTVVPDSGTEVTLSVSTVVRRIS
ncbi:hypothetical protein [Streptacidiphilus sp. MAP5-52]|uniref:hypothetical protein n=1 Tax=Streptacidiphilus sp. MAP5-52 TaxID=3156267 RepID=UPI003510DF84